MGWARGELVLPDGRRIEAGYDVADVCWAEGCATKIDRGLAWRCGGADFDLGCGGYYCGEHLGFVADEEMCDHVPFDAGCTAPDMRRPPRG